MEVGGFVLKDRYQLMAQIGKGGMSEVFLAKDLDLDSYWAVKKVTNNSSAEYEAFRQEVELLASLNHPDIPRIVDRAEIGRDYYVVMDFVDGVALSKLVLADGPQPEAMVVEWAKTLCDVLEYLHTARENPIVYRDMKPDNVMLTQAGRTKLVDFGIAIECPRGERLDIESLGTKGFAAPEQYKDASNRLDERSDLYSLGATLFYLCTGEAPSQPPNGVPPLRQVRPKASEGMEYIIARCTADDPEERYQSVAQLRSDLGNIEKLSRAYRHVMRSKLLAFVACLLCSVLFLGVGFSGRQWVEAEREDRYQVAFQTAMAYDRQGEYKLAAEYYTDAIETKPEDRETYVLWFNAVLPHETDGDTAPNTKLAIDEFRKRYLDNPHSHMYQDVQLMYLVARRCVEVEDPVYARYALDYIAKIKDSREYQSGSVNTQELNSYEVFAMFIVQQAQADFTKLAQALQDLEAYTDTAALTADEQLAHYYTLIKMYSAYPTKLEDAYQSAYRIGQKARSILESNRNDESLMFNNIISLYELVAEGQYNNASLCAAAGDKQRAYLNCLEWLGYLEEMGVDLSENLLLKKANACKGLFDLHNTPQQQGQIGEETRGYLEEAIGLYETAVQKNPASFLGHIYLAQAYLDLELLKPEDNRNYTQAMGAYNAALALRDTDDSLSSTEILQFAALARRMQSMGLAV